MRTMLRAEGVAVLAASVALFFDRGGDWPLLVALFLAPDLAMLGYLAGPAAGSRAYNVLHHYGPPVLLFTAATIAGRSLGADVALVWLAHIGLDCTLGYGLKYPTAFRHTHLDRV